MLTLSNIAQNKILEQFTEDELRDIAEYGCESGCASGFIYYYETSAFFDRHGEEIEDYMEQMLGETYLADFASRSDSMKHLKNALVWAFVEMVAQDAVHN
tara:strand:- start:424 stop:723 length:300 start_codon:yes stop_codon:yes gene_type:complete